MDGHINSLNYTTNLQWLKKKGRKKRIDDKKENKYKFPL